MPLARSSLNPNDADDSDSSQSSSSPVRVPRRSATVSPSTRNSFRHCTARRRSDVNLNCDVQKERRERRRSMVRASRERSESRRNNLRKTNSEPSVDAPAIDIQTLQQLLLSLPKFTSSAIDKLADSDSGGEDAMSTEIEELKDAAKSIQSLQRVLALPSQHSSDRGVFSEADDASLTTAESTDGVRMSGISTRLGHPRGVMQFIPSARSNSRKTSSAKKGSYLSLTDLDDVSFDSIPSAQRTRRRGVVDQMFSPSSPMLNERSSKTLAGVKRFSKLLDSFRSRPNTPDPHPSISWSPFMYSENPEDDEGRMEDSLHEADILLWKKRSRASLRRHNSVRNLAARELIDTEKSFVEGLEFLVTKYMRPLRQPLECTLIEASLVDKIFYRIPEILAHHQILLVALSTRLENWHKDSGIGDVLFAHFSKQSMIDTYIGFVNNFKFAKAAISQARQKHAFEKYYSRCCRDHHNKLDLDALLISPIQRVPRYELIVKQLLKHTPVEHDDREKLLRAQRHIHMLAMSINQHKDGNEEMEQRLREIEAIVDGLDDLVSKSRTLLRYDIVSLLGKQRCVFMLSDQLLLTSVKKKGKSAVNKITTQSMDLLENNRFKLLIKISLDDVQIARDTLTQLQDVERNLETSKEDDRVIKKILQLSNLLKCEKQQLIELLEGIESTNALRIRSLSEQMNNNPELTTVHVDVTTTNGTEMVGLEFGNAEKRSVWEATLKEAKRALIDQQIAAPNCQLKSIIAHQTRPGLQLCTATVVPGKRADSAPFVWICASDKFSGQVAVMSLENGETSIESCSAIGNAAVTAMCTVPPPQKAKKRKLRSERFAELQPRESINDLNSSGSESDSSADEASSSNSQTTVWIGNDDGEVFVVNSTERVRSRARDRLARLRNSITAICAANGSVFVATSYSTNVQLLAFRPHADRSWDLENPVNIEHNCKHPISAITQIGQRVILASGNCLHSFYTDGTRWKKPSEVLPSSDAISVMCVSGASLFVSGRRSTIVYVVDVFTLCVINHFNIAPVVRSQLAGRDDILREHKMGCLRVSCLAAARSHLWVGTSAGFVLSTPVHQAKNQPTPNLNVCELGHSGPCRILLPVTVASNRKKRTSLNIPSQQSSQLLVVSCGEGLDDKGATQDPSTDAVNHLIFWKCS